MRRLRHFAYVFVASLLIVEPAGGCDRDARLDAVVAGWQVRQQPPVIEGLDVEQAVCFRKAFMNELAAVLGPIVGYKVGVYTAAARKTYATATPVVGELRKQMLLDAGSTVSEGAGVALVSEADFILVIADEGINDARTREQAYRHVRGYRPFVELPDLNYRGDVKPDLGQLVALNVNARLGVLGEEVALPQTQAGFEALEKLRVEVTVTGPSTEVRASGVAQQTLGDPLEIVLAARDGLAREGMKLQAGDLISIGTLTPPRPVKAGETLHIRYHVLPSPNDLSVTFVP